MFVNTVPTAKMRRGDFSELSTPIYDPLTTVAGPGGTFTRSPFPGNIIPPSRWDPVTAKLMNAYPLPTSAALSNNLVTTPTRTQDWNQFDARIDHTQSERDNFLVRYSWSKTATTNPFTFPDVQIAGISKEVGLGNEDTFAGTSGLVAQHAVLGWVHVFSPRLVLDTRVGYNRFNLDFAQAGVDVGDQLGEQLGVPNSNQQDEQNGIPIFSPAGYTGIGQSRSLPILRKESTYQAVANLTYVADKHTIKAGFDVRRRHMGEFQTNRGNGRFNFAPNITNNPANNTGGHVMASFLLGAPSLIEQDYLLADVAIRGTEYGFYIADDWRVNSKLTLNLGLRYELDTPFSEEANQWASFDPATASVLVAGRNGVSETAGVETFYKAFAPRLGFAYQLGAHTVVRGGAGIFWNTPGNGGNVLRLHRHVPFGPIYSFNPGNQFVSRRVSDGFPAIPTVSFANADSPTGSVIGVDPEYQPGYARQFNLTVEREMFASLLLKASYVGNQGRHLDTAYNLNQAVPGPGPVNNRRPVLRRASHAGRRDVGGVRRLRRLSRVPVERGEAAVGRPERAPRLHVVPFHRHRGTELRRRRRRPAAARPEQPARRPRQLAVRHPPPAHHRRELPAALRQGPALAGRGRRRRLPPRRMAGEHHRHLPDRAALHADPQRRDGRIPVRGAARTAPATAARSRAPPSTAGSTPRPSPRRRTSPSAMRAGTSCTGRAA